jgi:hypothetical protein
MHSASTATERFRGERAAGEFHLLSTVYGSGRVPHVRPSVHPDFLSSSLALTNFMWLSLMNAAHTPVGGAGPGNPGHWAENDIFPMPLLAARGLLLVLTAFYPQNKNVGRGCARPLRPMYALANMGHPSREPGFVVCSRTAVLTCSSQALRPNPRFEPWRHLQRGHAFFGYRDRLNRVRETVAPRDFTVPIDLC